jgi:allantoin racemase
MKPLKIWWQDVFPKEVQIDEVSRQGYYNRIQGDFMKVAREGTQVDIRHVKYSSYILDTLYLEMLNNLSVIEGIIEAERQGYDAAIIGCGNDPALYESRQAVDIPVIGITEAALLLGCSLANKIGLVTVSEGCASIIEDRIHKYRLASRVAWPIQVFRLKDPIKDIFKMILEPESIHPQFEELCRKCISDGAEIIVPACAALSPAASLAKFREVPETGVPVMDINQIGVKAAEMQVDLLRSTGLRKSQKGLYKSIKPAVRDRFQKTAVPSL